MQLTRNFTMAEVWKSTETPSTNQIRTAQMLAQMILQPLRDFVGKPIIITSGKRAAAIAGGAENSEHLYLGNDGAADLNIGDHTVLINLGAFDWLAKNCLYGIGQLIWYTETTHLHVSLAGRNQSELLVCTSQANHRYSAIKRASEIATFDKRLQA